MAHPWRELVRVGGAMAGAAKNAQAVRSSSSMVISVPASCSFRHRGDEGSQHGIHRGRSGKHSGDIWIKNYHEMSPPRPGVQKGIGTKAFR